MWNCRIYPDRNHLQVGSAGMVQIPTNVSNCYKTKSLSNLQKKFYDFTSFIYPFLISLPQFLLYFLIKVNLSSNPRNIRLICMLKDLMKNNENKKNYD